MKKTFAAIPALALSAALGLALAAPAHAGGRQSSGSAGVSVTTTVTNASGTISQLNYNEQGYVDGFVLGGTTLIRFPSRVCSGVGSLGAVGNTVTYSGSAVTNASTGLQAVRISAYTNTTTAASYTPPTAPTTSAYAATAGTITLLNYDRAGAINGFVFTPSGSTTALLVKFGGAVRNTTLTSLLVAGSAATVTGTTTEGETHCGATAAVGTVQATTLVVGGSTFTFNRVGR